MNTKEKIACPACGKELTKVKAGKITVDACINGCGGIWFDAFELDEVNESNEVAGNVLLNIKRNPAAKSLSNMPHNCPVCNVAMLNYPLSLGRRFIVDECPECGGFWLDGGEFDAMRNNSDMSNAKGIEAIEYKSRMAEGRKNAFERIAEAIVDALHLA